MAKFKVGDYFDKAFENADFDVADALRGVAYGIDDQDNHLMYEFNDHGQCINVRPLARGEKQRKIKLNNVG